MPHDFPEWDFVYQWFRQWCGDGTFIELNRLLCRQIRIENDRDPDPSLGIMDARSVKSTEVAGVRGFDGGKKVKGIKRHIVVDTLGTHVDSRSPHGGDTRLPGSLSGAGPNVSLRLSASGKDPRGRRLWSIWPNSRKLAAFRQGIDAGDRPSNSGRRIQGSPAALESRTDFCLAWPAPTIF